MRTENMVGLLGIEENNEWSRAEFCTTGQNSYKVKFFVQNVLDRKRGGKGKIEKKEKKEKSKCRQRRRERERVEKEGEE